MSLTPEESFRNSYYYFIDAVRTLASDPDTACERMGDFNVACELKDDVQAGRYIAESGLLSAQAKAEIGQLVVALDEVPARLLSAAQGRQANLQAMSDEAWVPLRAKAADLLAFLDSFTNANNRWLLQASPS
jgi:hypothetical protein